MKKLKVWISLLIAGAAIVLLLTAFGGEEIEATKKPFPKFTTTDFKGNELTNDIFGDYDVTIVNFWSNTCGSCIAEMPELEQYYREFKDEKVNLIGVAVSAGDSEEERAQAEKILREKGVTYTNLIPDIKSDFYNEFIGSITGYPITYIVDRDGNMVGAPLVGVVANQEEKLMKRIDDIIN